MEHLFHISSIEFPDLQRLPQIFPQSTKFLSRACLRRSRRSRKIPSLEAPVYRWILLALSEKISMAYLPTNLLSLALINSILFSNMKRLFTRLCLKLLKTVLVKEQMQWYKYMVCILESKWAEIYHDLIKTIIIDRDTWFIISAIIH